MSLTLRETQADRPWARWPIALVCLAALLAVGLVSVAPAQAQAPPGSVPGPGAAVAEIRAALEAGESVEVIVGGADGPGLPGTAARSAGPADVAELKAALAAKLELAPGKRPFNSIAAVSATLNSVEELDALLQDGAIGSVEPAMTRAELFNTETIHSTGVRFSHQGGIDGSGTTVAVIDSGVQGDHPDLRSALSYEACFISAAVGSSDGYCRGGLATATGVGTAADDSIGHGTAVSGVISSAGSIAPMGLAPAADLEVYKIYADGQGGQYIDVLYALDHIVKQRPDVDVINMSFGYPTQYSGSCDDDFASLKNIIDVLNRRGVLVVAASGNKGLSTNGAPACLSNVISVAASIGHEGSAGYGQVASFSNVSLATDVVAPGVSITTTKLGSTFGTSGGTSFSSPAVAACIALMVQSGITGAAALTERVVSPGTMAEGTHRDLPLIDCAVGSARRGDVDCSGTSNVVDALMVAQFEVGIRAESSTWCPGDPTTQLNPYAGDMNRDGKTNIVDALLIAQCSVGVELVICPD